MAAPSPKRLQKGIRALDIGITGFGSKLENAAPETLQCADRPASFPGRIRACLMACRWMKSRRTTGFDPWFVRQMADIITIQHKILGIDPTQNVSNW